MSMFLNTRRDFLKQSMYLGAAAFTAGHCDKLLAMISPEQKTRMKFGLVTYLWGKDWDLPTLIANCEKTRIYGVELRTGHAHGVEANIDAQNAAKLKNASKIVPSHSWVWERTSTFTMPTGKQHAEHLGMVA